MKSHKLGKNISGVEVQNISPFGVWLLIEGYEYFLSYSDYPWFKKATVSEIFNVQLVHDHHLVWPDLDVDLEMESLENLEKFPLKYRA